MMESIADIIKALRGVKSMEPGKPGPMGQRRGYVIYSQEQKALGEPVLPYEEWLKQQE